MMEALEDLGGGRLQAEVDLSAVAANVRSLRRVIGPDCGVIAVVKADGYGLGAPWIASAALEGGASMLAVACVDEGVQLRKAGYTCPVLVMGYVPPGEAAAAVEYALTVVLHGPATALSLQAAAARAGLPDGAVAVHIKVDTGLGRYGCLPSEFLPLARRVLQHKQLRLEGLMTHFANADAEDLTFAREQLKRFNLVRQEAARNSLSFEIVHAANTAAALALPEARFDMVRSGITLSGNLPAPHLAGKIELRYALALRTRLARVYEAAAGDSVGYGRTWVATAPSRVGLIPVGYADGFTRALSNRGEVLVRGRRCPVIGRVSMDQASVDLTAVPGVSEGDEVVVIGQQGEEMITAGDIAGRAGTIAYEILCGLSRRVPRRYFRDGEPVGVRNLLGCYPRREGLSQEKEELRG